MARAKVDFQIVDHGTMFLLYANTRRAKQWVKENMPPDHVTFGDASLVGQRFIDDITDGIRADDLDLDFSRVPLPN